MTITRMFGTALIAALLSLGALGVAQDQEFETAEEGQLTIAMSGEYPPFSMPDDEGNMIGFDVDVANELAERVGLEPNLVQAQFSAIIAGVQSGRYDASVASHARTEEREQAVQFLDEPYYYSGAQFFVDADSEYDSVEELQEAGAQVAVDRGGTNQQWLEDNGYGDITSTYSGVQESLLAIRQGQAEAIFTSPIVGNLAISEQGFDLRPIGDLVFEENAWVTVREGNDELKAALEDALDSMREDGTLQEISERWIGADITTPPSE